MIRRCADLDILRPDEAERLWIARSRRGWHRREPLDNELPVESVRTLKHAFDLLLHENIRTKADIVADLRMNSADIEALAGLPHGYLSDGPSPLRLIDRKRPGSNGRQGGGGIVAFPETA